MVFGSRKFSLNFMSHTYAYSNIANKCHPPINEDGPKESVAMIDRSKDEKAVKDKVVKSLWWLKMRNKKRSVKLEKESPKDATKSKKRPLEVMTRDRITMLVLCLSLGFYLTFNLEWPTFN
ncbi:hypothetical protein HanRHA438_Chr09g0384381 [Helianthus annuus]|nr:hypothetical protein HanRHA438_Chr09g0384381 [Helianthus annuus]